MRAVAIEVPVIAVVQAEDVAGSGGTGFGFREIGLSVGGDGLHAVNEPGGGLDAPVTGDQGPGDIGQAVAVKNFTQPGAAKTKGRTKPTRFGPEDLLDSRGAAEQFFARFVGSAEKEIGMGVGVIADDVATRGGFLHKIGALADEFADEEESGAGVVLGEEIKEFRCDGRIRAVVEGEGQLIGGSGVRKGGTEKLGAGIYGAIGGHDGGAGYQGWGSN